MTAAAVLKAPQSEGQTLAQLYEDIWTNTTYRKGSPGERALPRMLEALKPHIGDSFIDFGCGTGRPAKELQKRGYGIVAVDFAYNCLDLDSDIPFLVADLTDLPKMSAEYGYCTDVMEHVEPERVDEALAGIARCVRNAVFFSIALIPDRHGPALVGKPLHLTVKDAEWWYETMLRHWPEVKIIDRNTISVSIVCRKENRYPPGFSPYRDGLVNTVCNTPIETCLENVRINAALADIPWLYEAPAHDRVAVLVGGGPSLKDSLDEIKTAQKEGMEIIALNGSGQYLVQHGIKPDTLIVIDPREANVNFVKTDPASCYLLASQCHPAVFDAVPSKHTVMFHLALPGLVQVLPKSRTVTQINGMVSVGLVAMTALWTAGCRTMHLYGYDSSDADDGGASHAYPQDLSKAEARRVKTWFNDREYSSSYAMFTQAKEFEAFSQMLVGFGVCIVVHGTGLLPDIAKEMAKL